MKKPVNAAENVENAPASVDAPPAPPKYAMDRLRALTTADAWWIHAVYVPWYERNKVKVEPESQRPAPEPQCDFEFAGKRCVLRDGHADDDLPCDKKTDHECEQDITPVQRPAEPEGARQ